MGENRKVLQNTKQQAVDLRLVFRALRQITDVGMMGIPTEKEIRTMMEEMQKNPQEFVA